MLRWPTAATVSTYSMVALRLSALFALVYFGCLWLTSKYDFGVRLYFDWERQVPLIPMMVYVYFSIALLFTLPVFVLQQSELRALERRFAIVTLVAGVAFLVLSARLGYPPRASLPTDPLLLRGIALVDAPRNLVPSLHVAYTVLLACYLYRKCPGSAVLLSMALWAVLLAASTLLVHQHHLIDVLSGALLGWFGATRYAAQKL